MIYSRMKIFVKYVIISNNIIIENKEYNKRGF